MVGYDYCAISNSLEQPSSVSCG